MTAMSWRLTMPEPRTIGDLAAGVVARTHEAGAA